MGEDKRQADTSDPIRIVISYRRRDSPAGAARLRESLAPHFGRQNVFLDIDTLRPGVNWRKTIPETVANCDVFLPVIGLHWLDAVDERGRRRLDLPNDVLRFEIATALSSGKPIIPIQLHGASMPDADDLPEDIAELTDYMSIRIDDDDWEGDVQKLVRAVEELRAGKAEEEEAQRRAAEDERRRQEASAAAEEERRRAADEERRQHEAEQRRRADEERLRAEEAERTSSAPESLADVATETAASDPMRPTPSLFGSRRTLLVAAGILAVTAAVVLLLVLVKGDGGGGGGEAEEPFPNTAETELLGHVPSDVQASCSRSSSLAAPADITCQHGEDIYLNYMLFETADEMRSMFDTLTADEEPSEVCGLNNGKGPWHHTEGGETGGVYFCYDDETVGPQLHWTDRDLKIYTNAFSYSEDGPAMGQAWRDDKLGPER